MNNPILQNRSHLESHTERNQKATMASKLTLAGVLPLPNSNSAVTIPRLGFGVYRTPGRQCEKSCLNAIRAGYRHIDTAQFYANENEVGDAVRNSGLDRKELFVTTKILSPAGSPQATYEKLLNSVQTIGGTDGYVDLFLIHSSSSGKSGRKELWLALEKLLEEGKTRSIGVSNFGVRHIEEMKEYAKVWPPHVNQIEVSRGRFLLSHDICNGKNQKKKKNFIADHAVVIIAASSMVPAKTNRCVLQVQRHCCRGLLSPC